MRQWPVLNDECLQHGNAESNEGKFLRVTVNLTILTNQNPFKYMGFCHNWR